MRKGNGRSSAKVVAARTRCAETGTGRKRGTAKRAHMRYVTVMELGFPTSQAPFPCASIQAAKETSITGSTKLLKVDEFVAFCVC